MNGLLQGSSRMRLRAATVTALAGAAFFGLVGCSAPAAPAATGAATSTSTADVNDEARALLPDDVRERGTLRLTADFMYPPFTFMDGEDRSGLDFELGNELAHRLGLEAEWTTQSSFDAIVPSVQNGRFDAAMDSINANPERLQAVSFVTYIRTYAVLVVPKGNPAGLDPENLCGSVMSVGSASADLPLEQQYSLDCVSAGQDPIEINQYTTTNDQMLSVQSGRSEGSAQGSAPAAYMIGQAGDTYESLGPIRQLNGDLMRSAQAGIAFAKTNTALGEAMQVVMADMQSDGFYSTVVEKWGLDEDSQVPAAIVE